MIDSWKNNEPQRRRERREKKQLCQSVKSVVKIFIPLDEGTLMGNSLGIKGPLIFVKRAADSAKIRGPFYVKGRLVLTG
jgi:hypothetical protein